MKVFGRKCYILKYNRKGKLDAKSEEGIFLGYSTRSKAYKCLNTNTNKIVESVNVKVDEYLELHEVEHKEEPEDYITFMYYYKGMPEEVPKIQDAKQVSMFGEIKFFVEM